MPIGVNTAHLAAFASPVPGCVALGKFSSLFKALFTYM